MSQYELPERRTPSKLRLVLPTIMLLAVMVGAIFGAVYAVTMAVNALGSLIEAVV